MVLISNGHHKFILATAAVEANKRGVLEGYITGGYPSPWLEKTIEVIGARRYSPIARLLRRKEDIPHRKIHSLWLSEAISQTASIARAVFAGRQLADYLQDRSLAMYALQAKAIVRRSEARIYHYRSGYGLQSVPIAKRKGMLALCDHSIAHPAVLEYLTANGGRMPQQVLNSPQKQFWAHILQDIEQADHLLVNSNFVKETFLSQGWPRERLHVIYNGLDDEFLRAIPCRINVANDADHLQLLFAGDLGPRKGGKTLIEAMLKINDLPWSLTIVGNIDTELRKRHAQFFQDSRVHVCGYVPREQLAIHMTATEIFVFPSLAEGSARVVQMAIACGCYVITTPNSGSIVEDGVHGAIVAPGDSEQLAQAIRNTISKREYVRSVGLANARLVQSQLCQAAYGSQLLNLYNNLSNEMP